MQVNAKWLKLGMDEWEFRVGRYSLAVVGRDYDFVPYWAVAGRLTCPVRGGKANKTHYAGGGKADSIADAKSKAEQWINGKEVV